MKHPSPAFCRLYRANLRKHLAQGTLPDPRVIDGIGGKARKAKVSTLELAKLHERLLVVDLLPDCPQRKRNHRADSGWHKNRKTMARRIIKKPPEKQ